MLNHRQRFAGLTLPASPGSQAMLMGGSAFMGYAVGASDGPIGIVCDFPFDDTACKVRRLVVDTGRWLPGRKVLIHPSATGPTELKRRRLPAILTKAQVKNRPVMRQDQPVSERRRPQPYDYYGWTPFEAVRSLSKKARWASLAASPLRRPNEAPEVRNAGLLARGSSAPARRGDCVAGYHAHAGDCGIGHVPDFLVGYAAWSIRYRIAARENWALEKDMLLSPYAIKEAGQSQHQIQTAAKAHGHDRSGF